MDILNSCKHFQSMAIPEKCMYQTAADGKKHDHINLSPGLWCKKQRVHAYNNNNNGNL